ncbi:DUF2785 domain-containing protein [Rugamonas sp.]|uniref:DUF2785 domain-containing protein n=1 Tax=Rugamonas sp. TaxID=1926287 RepID=UPI0025EE8ECC|nr:DUF2785 domain-containing protein [Rugamonas sp.]
MRILLILLGGLAAHAIATAACPPAGMSRAQLVALSAAGYEVADNARRQALALGLVDCLGDPDPVLRDEIAFGALESWMRSQKLEPATLRSLRTTQLASLKQADAAGLAQPFAAIVLGEVANADRMQPFMSAAERTELVQAGAAYLSNVRDYRGYDLKEGWRHAVAHAADMMMELALNPALSKKDQRLILSAVATQLSAAGAHTPAQFFLYSEGERLAAPVLGLASHADFSAAEWDEWFSSLAITPSEHDAMLPQSMAHRHNLRSFLMTLYISLSESKDGAQRERLLPYVRRELKLDQSGGAV